MCAPEQFAMQVDEQPLRRFNTTSSGATTLVGDSNYTSPLGSMKFTPGEKSVNSPFVLTGSDDRQWIDLNILSPKLVVELQRQNAPFAPPETPTTMSKGAAIIKAWARQSKRGIDIRLRRKVDDGRDQVTDFHLEPNTAGYPDAKSASKTALPGISELPGGGNEVFELHGTSKAQELSSEYHDPPSRSSTGESVGETLPRYEPSARHAQLGQIVDQVRRESPPRLRLDTNHQPSSSASSIVHTPEGGLDVGDVRQRDASPVLTSSSGTILNFDRISSGQGSRDAHFNDESLPGAKPQDKEESQNDALNVRLDALNADLDATKRDLEDQRKAKADFQEMLTNMRDLARQLESQSPGADPKRNVSLLRGLHVAQSQQYETETDAEPRRPSPQRRKSSRSGLKTQRPVAQKAKKNAIPRSKRQRNPDKQEDAALELESLLRRTPTLPKKLAEDAEPDEVWVALIQAQTRMLGPDHPLVYQAKAGLSISRNNGHQKCKEDVLSALRESKDLAVQMLGQVHPQVPSFAANLQMLHRMLGIDIAERDATKTHVEDPAIGKARSPSTNGQDAHASTPPSPLEVRLVPTSTVDSRQTRADSAQTVDPSRLARASPLGLPTIITTEPPLSKDLTPPPDAVNPWANTYSRPHRTRSNMTVVGGHTFAALTQIALRGIIWLQTTYGPEPAVENDKVRVRWTCSCGEQLYDDFSERRQGAARELEAYLNRPRTHQNGGTPTSPASSQGTQIFGGSSTGQPSTQTSWSSYGPPSNQASPIDGKGTHLSTSMGGLPYWQTPPEPPWLLTCATESRHTPKLAHLDMSPYKITSDKDFATTLRKHYFSLNKRWYRTLKIRGLTTIEFVQFEVHQNKFADIRKCPDMPPPTVKDYDFQPGELVPPVGSTYLLHLFRHPEDYDGELITYLRSPKKNSGQLRLGVGWGIHLREGFLPDKVWMLMSGLFALGSLVFGAVWAWKKHDIQGAFGVSAWICTLGVLAVGWVQACLG